MEKYITYIEDSLKSEKDCKTLYQFKKSVLDEMTQRANEVEARGLRDKKVLSDLIISEHPNLKADYAEYYKKSTQKSRERKKLIYNAVGSVIFIFTLLVVYLTISFATQKWGQTWVLMVGGICLWISYLLDLVILKVTKMRQMFHLIARAVLALNVMLISTVVFIVCLAIFHIHTSWVVFIIGVAGIFVADAIYATVTKKKLVLINYLIYIPPVGAMLYIILGALGAVSWNTGWLLVPLALLVDVAVVVCALIKNAKEKEEVEDAWKEN